MTIWFTADQHFGHALLATDRQFATVVDMDEYLIEQWNVRVRPKDTVYCIGDFTLENPIYACKILRRLSGKIKIVPAYPGHDRNWVEGPFDFQEPFEGVPGWPHHVELMRAIETIKVPKVETKTGTRRNELICLCHYPMKTWDRSHYGSWHLHGHSHGKLGIVTGKYSLDVGVDNCYDLAPISAERVAQALKAGPEPFIGSGLKL